MKNKLFMHTCLERRILSQDQHSYAGQAVNEEKSEIHEIDENEE